MSLALNWHTQYILRTRDIPPPKTRLLQIIETLPARSLGLGRLLGALQRQYFLFQLFAVPRQPCILPNRPEYITNLHRSSRTPFLRALLPISHLYRPSAYCSGCRSYCIWRLPVYRFRLDYFNHRRSSGCCKGM
jgi:hypothetical protein